MQRILLSLIPTLVLISGCSASKDIEAAQDQVTSFHRNLDAGRLPEIYATSGPEIRRDMSEPQFTALLSGVHGTYGNVVEAKGIGWHVNYATGSTVTLIYDTRFARGNLQETFVYSLAGNRATLAGYHFEPRGAGVR